MGDGMKTGRDAGGLPPVGGFSLTTGFAIALGVWLTACVGRWPTVNVQSEILIVVLLGVMLAGGVLAGTVSTRHAVGALVTAGVVNTLLVGSVVSVQSQTSGAADVNRVTISGLIWIPGSIAASAVVGVVGGFIGGMIRGRVKHRQSLLGLIGSAAGLAWVAIATTLCLIALGGIVTSSDAGLAVPDWPNSYGYNMFLFPFTKMVGGIFYEHAHRLVGSLVGLEVLILTMWILRTGGSLPRTTALRAGQCPGCGYDIRRLPQNRCPECGCEWSESEGTVVEQGVNRGPGVSWLAGLTLLLVIVQGVLGGARVFMFNQWGDEGTRALAVIHACTAQIFLFTLGSLAFFLWTGLPARLSLRGGRQKVVMLLPIAILFQTLAGAILRHFAWGPALHLHLTNLIVVIPLIILATRWARLPETAAINRSPAPVRAGIHGLLGVQLLLGGYSWWVIEKYDAVEQATSLLLTCITAGHVVGGALLMLLSSLLAMRFCIPVVRCETARA